MSRAMQGLAAIILSAAVLVLLAAPVPAEVTKEDVVDPGPANEAYDDAVAGKRLQSDILLLRPETDFTPGEDQRIVIQPEPEPEERERQNSATMGRWMYGLLFGALLAGVIALFVIYGGNIAVSFGGAPIDGSRDDAADDAPEEDPARAALMAQPIDSFLASLGKMADRREALILLVSRALERSAALNDLRLGRSQTARDVVRILPRSWRHLGAIRRLVREVEFVHFGGRDLPEEIWQECLDAARPIFGERVA